MLTRSRSVIIAVVGCAIILAASAQSLARRTATTTTAPATRASDKSAKAAPKTNTKSSSRYDDDEPVDTRTGRARAQQFEKGKPVDQAKTRSQLDKLTGQVNSLEAALRNSKTNKAAAKVEEDEDDLPAQRRKSRRPTTQPATQPVKATKSTRNRYVEEDYEY